MYKRSRSLRPHSRMPVFWCWTFLGMTAAMLILHPELMSVANAAQLANSTDLVAGGAVNATTTFGGEEVGLIPVSSIDAVLSPLPELPLLGITNERFVSLIRENETVQLALQKEGMP